MYVTPEDVTEFTNSDVYQNLLTNSPDPTTSKVGVEYAYWTYPLEKVVITLPTPEVYPIVVNENGNTAEYSVRLVNPPISTATVNVIPGSTQIYLDDGIGGIRQPGEPMPLIFNASNYNVPQPVIVHAVNDSLSEGPERAVIGHDLETPEATEVSHTRSMEVLINDNECGGKGFLASDSNFDCRVNTLDLLRLRTEWLQSTMP